MPLYVLEQSAYHYKSRVNYVMCVGTVKKQYQETKD